MRLTKKSNQILLSTFFAMLISGLPSMHSLAAEKAALGSVSLQSQPKQVVEPETIEEEPVEPDPDVGIESNKPMIIPEASAIAVTFCSAVKFENEREDSFPVTLFLARPIVDADGGILAPVNSLVNARVEPSSKGIKIQIDGVVIGGRVIPVKTSTLSIPILSTTKDGEDYEDYDDYGYGSDTYYSGRPGRGIALNVANGLQSWLGNQEFLGGTASGLLGAGLAIAAGVTAATDKKPQQEKLIEVPEGGTLIFPLLSPVTLPPKIMNSIAALAPEQTSMSLCSKDVNVAEESSDQDEDTYNDASDESSENDDDVQ